MIDAWVGIEEGPQFFEVYECNWRTVEVFLSMATQWVWSGGMEPRRTGLNYAALSAVYEGLAVPRRERPAIFPGLQAMELAALQEFR